MVKQPLAEVFGFRTDDFSQEAVRYRHARLCPFNNRVPSCTKDKVQDPLGVCSIYHRDMPTITCPVRFRENWHIATDAAQFFFPKGTNWTSLTEIRLVDANSKSAGNIDVVLVSYDNQGQLIDFGSLEVQAVYISGNIRDPFKAYMREHESGASFDWEGRGKYPRADFLSSSRKRLAPQLLYKGSILHTWGKKMAVAVDRHFFAELPELPEVEVEEADVAWLIYELVEDPDTNRYGLTRSKIIYTQFTPALLKITTAAPGPEENFRRVLQRKLDEKYASARKTSGTLSLSDIFRSDK